MNSAMLSIGQKARLAKQTLAQTDNQKRRQALLTMAEGIQNNADLLLSENRKDLAAAKENNLPSAFLDRLALNKTRVSDMQEGLLALANWPDPINRVLEERTLNSGLILRKVAVPLGVIGIIYESRPNVTADCAGLCIRAGSACILRGGKEAFLSNRAIANVIRAALSQTGLPEDCVQLIEDTSRASAQQLMNLHGYLDLLIPRGGKSLIDHVIQHARVPVLQTGEGVCHIYVDRDADLSMAAEIILNAKTSRPSVCNAVECILVHKSIADKALPLIRERLGEEVEIRGDKAACQLLTDAVPAIKEDWGREFLGLILACRVVSSLEEALEHINRYGTGHSECIITENEETAGSFLRAVDAAAVYHNASTRFTDGGQFGLGAEIGISTQKLHARGPVGLRELTSYKYIVTGRGHIR